jgi:outer membrane protein insertion porin family
MHFGKSLALVLALILALGSTNAQAPQRYPIIAGIRVSGGAVGADDETIIAVSGLRVGQEAKPDALVGAIKNLWGRSQFADVRIDKERETALGVFLVIKVTEFPRLRHIEAVGNDEVSLDEITKAVDKRRGEIISPYAEYLARTAVKKLYEKEGMLFAKITSELRSADSANSYDLVLTINEGVEYHVGAIEFEGNKDFDDSDLAGAFEDTKTKAWWQIWKSSKFDIAKYEDDKKKLATFLAGKGYIDAEILDDTLMYDETTEKVTIRISIDEGRQVFIRSIKFIGNTVYPSEFLVRRLGMNPGDIYDAPKIAELLEINADQTDVKSLYADNGYLAARLLPEAERVSKDSIDLVVRVIEGDRFTIRRVEIVGNTKTKDRVIRRELFTRPGDYFNRSAIIRSVRGLGVINYFNPETLKPNVQPVDNTRVDITYNVEERSTDTFNASVGFAGAFGLTGSVGITLNNFSLSEPLRGGAGQIIGFQWEFGQASRLQTFQLSFTEPWLFGNPTSVGFNIYDTRQRFGFDVRRTGAQVNLGRRFTFPDDYFRGDWSVGFERIESNTETLFSRAGVNTAFTLSQTISRTSLDNVMFPTQGSRFSLITRWAAGAVGLGTTDFARVGVNFDMLNPLVQINGFNRLVLYLGSEFGYVGGLQTDTTIPPQELFYMGGNGLGGFNVTPLRGYRDRIIGPQDPRSGGPIGGRVQARFFTELRFALSLNPFPIYLLSFAEAGNVWENIRTSDPFGLKRSAGVGVRLLLQPIGLLGFDLGYGFDPEGSTGQPSGWQFHFQFGR